MCFSKHHENSILGAILYINDQIRASVGFTHDGGPQPTTSTNIWKIHSRQFFFYLQNFWYQFLNSWAYKTFSVSGRRVFERVLPASAT